MGPIRNPRWGQKRTGGYVIVSRINACNVFNLDLLIDYTCNSIWSVIKMPLKRKAGQKRGAAWSDDETRLREQSTNVLVSPL